MIRLDDTRDRIADKVPALVGRIGNAAEWAAIVQNNRLPQVTPAAFVLFGGLKGRKPDVVTGLFRQGIDEITSVVLVHRVPGEALGDKAIADVTPLVREIVLAVAGWGPEDAIGIYEFAQAELVGATDGALVFQIDFSLEDQLRIAS